MSLWSSGARRRVGSGSRRSTTTLATRVRRTMQWLVAVLLLCEWRFPPPQIPLLTEQRSALSAINLKRCRSGSACSSGTRRAAAEMDSLTYLNSIPDATMLRRWPDDGAPITVWIADAPGSPVRSAKRRAIARDAFHAWTHAGVPERFAFVPDSANAMVRVVWRKQLPDRRAGQVTRQADSDGWLHSATMELSVRNMSGAAQDTATLRAVSLHEVGHLLGLEHSPDERDIMAPWVVARQLSPRDLATARALYGIDPLGTTR